MKNLFNQPSLSYSDAPVGIGAWMAHLTQRKNTAWDQALRQFFDEHECGLPTVETLKRHGLWVYPHLSQTKGLWHCLFQWRGQIVLEGWFQRTEHGSCYVIHPHTADTPKPWDKTSPNEV